MIEPQTKVKVERVLPLTAGKLREILFLWMEHTEKNAIKTFKNPQEWADALSEFISKHV